MDHKNLETEYLDVLQNLEAAIVHVDSESDDLTDLEVIGALDYLIRAFTAEVNGRSAPFVRLSPLVRQIVDAVTTVAKYRTGQTEGETPTQALTAAELDEPAATESGELAASDEELASFIEVLTPQTVTTDHILACLRRIRISVKSWNASNGRRGYLEFVQVFVK